MSSCSSSTFFVELWLWLWLWLLLSLWLWLFDLLLKLVVDIVVAMSVFLPSVYILQLSFNFSSSAAIRLWSA